MIKEAISKVIQKNDSTRQEAELVMGEIMDGVATPSQIGSLLTALRMKGETVEEIAGFAKVMRQKAVAVSCQAKDLVDTCGTGGDGGGTFNISTAAAFVVAGAGQKVAKHGNRAMSSQTGSADVLEELGINITQSPENVAKCVDEIGIGFMFAPLFHTALKNVVGIRREMGVRTVFNILGPLANPAGVKRQLLGVGSKELTDLMAESLRALGAEHAMVVHGEGSLDEISLLGETKVTELIAGEIKSYIIKPNDYGFKIVSIKDIAGGNPKENAAIMKRVLAGEASPYRDAVVYNAAGALIAGGKARDFYEGIKLAIDSIDSGRAAAKVEQLKMASNA